MFIKYGKNFMNLRKVWGKYKENTKKGQKISDKLEFF